MIYEQLTLGICQSVRCTAEDFLARVSRLLESEKASKIQEELFSLKSCGWLKSDTLDLYSLRTSEDFSTMTGGDTFETIIGTMEELGYSVEWQMLNSRTFGIPQNRERVFIVGHLGGFCGRTVFPITEGDRDVDELQGHTNNTLIRPGIVIADRQ